MDNILRRNKPPKGLKNRKLENGQVQPDLICNLCDKCTMWYYNKNNEHSSI